MRLAIIGCGSLGSLFAAYLSSFVDVVMVGHWPQQIKQIHTNGLTLIRPDGHKSNHKFPVSADPAEFFPCDLALILVKAYQTDQAALDALKLLAENGVAVSLQNGLGNVDKLARTLGSKRVTQGITSEGANLVAPGIVKHAGYGKSFIGELPDLDPLINDLVGLLNQSGFLTTTAKNLDSLIWGKLVVNAGINPLTAILRVPNGFLLQEEEVTRIMTQAVLEAAAVTRAQSIILPYDDPVVQVKEVAQATASNRSSMLQDLQRGSQTEIQNISGVIVREGVRMRIPTPVNKEFLRILLSKNLPEAISESESESIRSLDKYITKGIS